MSVAAFEDAQRRTFRILADVVGSLRAGVTEDACVRAAMRSADAAGFGGFFRPPVVRFEPRPQRFEWPSKKALAPGMDVEIVLMPATRDAFGHVAITLPFEGDEGRLVSAARETCRAVIGFANRTKTSGELYVFGRAWANNHRVRLTGRALGFHCPEPEGMMGLAWPRGAWALTRLRRFQLEHLNPRLVEGLYAVRPRVALGGRAASFGELMLVTGDERRILGREGLDQVGRFG